VLVLGMLLTLGPNEGVFVTSSVGTSDGICDGAELAEGTSDADGIVEGLALGLPDG